MTPAEGPRREVSWAEFGELCQKLALAAHARQDFDAVVGIARGGSIVGATLSFMLSKEYFPIRLQKQGGTTRVIVPPTRELANRRVLLVDDLSRTGETFKIAIHELKRVGASSVTTCALVRREPGFRPDLCALVATAADKIAFPWGRELLIDGKFQLRKL
jgi:hypoxanthine phosphoribosyltransferase